jgi:hypothetical protein
MDYHKKNVEQALSTGDGHYEKKLWRLVRTLLYRWYAFRLSSVILVIGGFMHGHNIIKSVGINYEA